MTILTLVIWPQGGIDSTNSGNMAPKEVMTVLTLVIWPQGGNDSPNSGNMAPRR